MIPHFFLDEHGKQLFLLGKTAQAATVSFAKTRSKKANGLALIDRDGVVIQKGGYHQYHSDASHMILQPGVANAIRLLNQKGILAVLITNQPGIYKKLFSFKDLIKMTGEIQRQLAKSGASLDSVFFCPHAAPNEGDVSSQHNECTCRKPKPGMLNAAIEFYGASKEKSAMFGDFESDIEAAVNAKILPVFIQTRHDEFEEMQKKIRQSYPNTLAFDDLLEAVHALFGKEK